MTSPQHHGNNSNSSNNSNSPNIKIKRKLNIKRLTKKAQIIGQVFVYILAGVTFVLISLFGYNAITQFVSNSQNVEFLSFKNDLERSVKDIYTEYGAVRQEKYSLPAEYSQICLINLEAGRDTFTEERVNELCTKNALACSIVNEMLGFNQAESGSAYGKFDSNVFLTPTSPYQIKLYRFTLCDMQSSGSCTPVPYLCVPLNHGLLNLVLEGKGDHTEISQPQPISPEDPLSYSTEPDQQI